MLPNSCWPEQRRGNVRVSILLVFLQIAVFLVGFGTHYWDAYLSMPEKLIDGYKWRDHALNDTLNSNYVWWADYDEMGFWEFYSLKNFCIHAVPTSFITFLFALAYFPDREPLMGKLCGSIAKVGLHPMFCV